MREDKEGGTLCFGWRLLNLNFVLILILCFVLIFNFESFEFNSIVVFFFLLVEMNGWMNEGGQGRWERNVLVL